MRSLVGFPLIPYVTYNELLMAVYVKFSIYASTLSLEVYGFHKPLRAN